MMIRNLLSVEQAYEELEFLSGAEHALIVEYLTVSYALPAAYADAARTAGFLAQDQMRKLADVCGVLAAAGRPPSLDRAASLGGLPCSPAGPAAYANLLDRETAMARAVDQRWAALGPASPIDLTDLVKDGTTHEGALAALREALGDPVPDGLLATVRFEAETDSEADLLSAADAGYRAVVTALRAEFADDEAFNSYRQIAVTAMSAVDGVGRALARSGLVLSFNP
jgi:hypothetical protein